MGLLKMFPKGEGLFDPIGRTPGMLGQAPDLAKMMADVPPADLPAFSGQDGQRRGGLFGSGYGGEDIMAMLLRAASIAQGDYGAGAQFGSMIGARAREAAEAAAKRQQELEDYQAKLEIQQQFEEPPAPPAIVRNTEAFIRMPPEQRAAFAEMYRLMNPPGVMTGADGLPYDKAPMQAPAPIDLTDDDWNSGVPVGGGASNGTGGFPR
jgi:hypothetical protein